MNKNTKCPKTVTIYPCGEMPKQAPCTREEGHLGRCKPERD